MGLMTEVTAIFCNLSCYHMGLVAEIAVIMMDLDLDMRPGTCLMTDVHGMDTFQPKEVIQNQKNDAIRCLISKVYFFFVKL